MITIPILLGGIMTRAACRRRIAVAFVSTVIALTAPRVGAAQRFIEAHVAIGYTAGDREKWAGVAIDDWNETNYQGYAQVFALRAGRIALGAELGYQYLMWYQFDFGGFPVEREVEAWRILAIARVSGSGGLFAEFGGGLHMFDGFTDLGVAAGIGYRLPLAPKITLPLKLRADVVLDSDATLLPISLSAGVSFSIGP